jgi:hypothetical protein
MLPKEWVFLWLWCRSVIIYKDASLGGIAYLWTMGTQLRDEIGINQK